MQRIFNSGMALGLRLPIWDFSVPEKGTSARARNEFKHLSEKEVWQRGCNGTDVIENEIQHGSLGDEVSPSTREQASTAVGGGCGPLGVESDSQGFAPNSATAEVMHGLRNTLVSILLNAQMVAIKLPSYSRVRRNLRDIECSAQRCGMLLKRLEQQLRGEPVDAGNGTESQCDSI